MTTEVQSHGFLWERELCVNVYGATKEELNSIKYTNKTDLPGKFNRLDKNCDISIKTSGSPNVVCMADCLRIYDAVSTSLTEDAGSPLHLVVIHYKQCDETQCKIVTSIVEVDLTNSRQELFGTVTRAQLEDLVTLVKSIPKKRTRTAEEKKSIESLRDAIQSQSGAIYLNIKCDSGSQRRLQCSFNKFQQFLQEHPERVVERSDSNAFRGGVISAKIVSGRRKFNKKITMIPSPSLLPPE
jgi:hypothetical protein